MSGSDSDLPVHPLIARLDPRPDDRRRYVILNGFIGPTRDDGIVIVYPELDLSWCLEIPKDAILHAEPALPGLHSSPSRLIVNAEAEICRVECSRRRVELKFLGGPITGAHLSRAASRESRSGDAEDPDCAQTVIHNAVVVRPGPVPTSHCVLGGFCVSLPPAFPVEV